MKDAGGPQQTTQKTGKRTIAVCATLVLAVFIMQGCIHEADREPGWIVVTAWTPHFMFSQWTGDQQMTCLEDPGWQADGEIQYLYPSVLPDDLRPDDVDRAEINTYVTHTLPDDDPQVHRFLQNFQMTAEDEGDLMLRLQEGETHEDVARDYVENHPDIVEEWMEGVETDDATSNTLRLGVPEGWDGEILRSYMIAYILERDFGIEVHMDFLEAGPIYAGLAEGDLDIFAGGWMPIQQSHIEGREGQIVKAGDALPPGDVGLCFAVPQYIVDQGVVTLADLADHGDEFGRTVTGIESGAGMMITAQQKMDQDIYNLGDWELLESSTPAMLAEFDSAVGEWQG
jgi:ABC-type proline/glycine betaine transport system substrate-binding protein